MRPNISKLPAKVTGIHFGTFAPAMFWWFLILALLVYFRDEQPLKHKGPAPFIAVGCNLIALVADFLSMQVFYEEQIWRDCYVSVYLIYLPTIPLTMLPLMNYIRYVILLNLTRQNELLMKNSTQSAVPLSFKVLRVLKNQVTQYSILFTVTVLYIVYSVIIFAIFGWNCGGYGTIILRYSNFGIFGPVVFLVIGIQAVDYWNNRDLFLKCQLRRFFLEEDHYFYRLELWLVPMNALYAVLWVVISPYSSVLRSIFIECVWLNAASIIIYFPLLFTIISYLLRRKRRSSSNSDNESRLGLVNSIFLDSGLYNLFVEYSKHEFNLENVVFKNYCIQYKRSQERDRGQLLKQIESNFFMSSSMFEINVPKRVIDEIRIQIGTGNYPNTLLDEVEREIDLNLNDTFLRFRESKGYKSHLLLKQMIQEN